MERVRARRCGSPDPEDTRAAPEGRRGCALRFAAVGATLLGYALLFAPLYRVTGGAAAAVSGIPILLAGVLLGSRWGMGAAILCIPLHLLLFRLAGEKNVSVLAHVSAGLAFAAVGGVVGRLRDLGLLLRGNHARLEGALADAHQAHQALAEREAQLAQAQSLAHIGYWVLDLGSRATTWSTELCHILGEDPATASPSAEAWWQHVHPEDRSVLQRNAATVVEEDRPIQAEYRIVRKDGKLRRAYGRVQVLKDDAGRPIKLLGTVQDVTEHRELEAHLAAAERLATVGTLVAGLAHEINNPLSYVVNNLEFVREELARLTPVLPGGAPDELAAAAGEALEGADRVRRIVRDLMAFSRPDQRPVPVDVERVLNLSVDMASAEIRHRARLVKEYGGVPAVSGDASRLSQVFLNLIVNAAQAIPPGQPERHEIRLTTRLEQDQILVSVRDTGEGMAPDVRRRCFEPFFTTRPVGSGMGLGLSTSLAIVRALGGDIVVESEPGRGSVFTVNLLPGPHQAAQPGRYRG